MTKLTKEQINKIRCLCGACDHDVYDSKCAYNKILSQDDPAEAQAQAFVKFCENVIKLNQQSKKPKKAVKKGTSCKTTSSK